jgi:hypothetical protein
MRKPELFGPIGIAAVLAAFVALPQIGNTDPSTPRNRPAGDGPIPATATGDLKDRKAQDAAGAGQTDEITRINPRPQRRRPRRRPCSSTALSTTSGAQTPTLNDVTVCYTDTPFTDYPLTAGIIAKIVHITELRTRIDALRHASVWVRSDGATRRSSPHRAASRRSRRCTSTSCGRRSPRRTRRTASHRRRRPTRSRRSRSL